MPSNRRRKNMEKNSSDQEPNRLVKRSNMWILPSILTYDAPASVSFSFPRQHTGVLSRSSSTWPYPLTTQISVLGIQMILHAWPFDPSEFILLPMAPQCPTACSLHLAVSAPLDTQSAWELITAMHTGVCLHDLVCLAIYGLCLSICWISNPEGIRISLDAYKSLYIITAPIGMPRQRQPHYISYHIDECAHHRIRVAYAARASIRLRTCRLSEISSPVHMPVGLLRCSFALPSGKLY
ncbi:hypothetical protein V8C42DRAFT_130354 [Trichoderma barbatum]